MNSSEKSVVVDEAAVPWEEAAGLIRVKSRKTIVKLIADGFLERLPGVDRVLITRESLRKFLHGKAGI